MPLLGDWLLERLGISAVRSERRARTTSNRTTRISFEDVFAYCDLEQEEIDRSTVYDRDNFRNIKRASTFELLYGIIDAQVADLEAERLKLQADWTGALRAQAKCGPSSTTRTSSNRWRRSTSAWQASTEEQAPPPGAAQRAREDAEGRRVSRRAARPDRRDRTLPRLHRG